MGDQDDQGDQGDQDMEARRLIRRRSGFIPTSLSLLLSILLLGLLPGTSACEVQMEEDNSTEDLAGVALIVANAALVGYFAKGVSKQQPGRLSDLAGIGVGLGTIVLGVDETTSFSDGVLVLGIATSFLGVIKYIGRRATPDDQDSGRRGRAGAELVPYLARLDGRTMGFGLGVRGSF